MKNCTRLVAAGVGLVIGLGIGMASAQETPQPPTASEVGDQIRASLDKVDAAIERTRGNSDRAQAAADRARSARRDRQQE